ncbi:ATP-dependent zinc metalloprotease FtsH [bacterium]|nr:ATP-dependent zinc metalloprotease FtsH [bacterium]
MNHERDPDRQDDAPRPDGGGHGSSREQVRSVQPEIPRWRFWAFLLLVVIVGNLGYHFFGGSGPPERELAYSEFRHHVTEGRIERITIEGQRITGEMTPTEPLVEGDGGRSDQGGTDGADQPRTRPFATVMPPTGDDALLPMLMEQGVEVDVEQESGNLGRSLLVSLLPVLLIVGIGVFLISRLRGQGQRVFSLGESRAQKYEKTDESTTFDDVAGIEGAKTELREIIEFLRDPDRFRRLGGAPPKGILLVGPPGSGKTLLARATAGEAGVPFYSITGSDFMEMFVGVGASRVRSLFAEARKSSPSIVFIDELDSIGRHRGAGLGGGHDEREQTLNQLLSAMDGFEPQEGVIVMAATNRPDILDPALLRPGRFDRRVVVEQGGLQARLEILRIHARNKPLADDVDLEDLARATPGFSGADLENLLNEAALLAARDAGDAITREDLDLARDKILLGLKREGMDLDQEEWRLIAYHEAGHALVAAMLPRADRIQKVSIVPRGRAMGVTQQLPERDRYIQRREELVDRLTVLLGGRAAERVVFDTTTSGAENDLKVAADLSRRMVTDWGMGEGLENLALGGSREHVFLGEEIAERRPYGEETARIVDQAVHGLVTDAARQATGLLEEHRRALDRLANELLVHEELSGDRVDELLAASTRHASQGEPS